MTFKRLGVPVLLLCMAACSDEEGRARSETDAAVDGTVGAGGRSSTGTGGRTPNAGGASTGGTVSAGGTANAGGTNVGGSNAGGASGSTGGTLLDASADARSDGATPDAGDSAVAPEASCRGAASALCADGQWRDLAADGGAACKACPGPTATCANVDFGASSYDPATHVIRIELAAGSPEVLRGQAHVIWGNNGCNSPISTHFVMGVEADGDHTALTVNLSQISQSAIPCGHVEVTFDDGCCEEQSFRFNVVHDDDAVQTSWSCPDTSCKKMLASSPGAASGYYAIDLVPPSPGVPYTYCDMTTDGGGWTKVTGFDDAQVNAILGGDGRQLLKCTEWHTLPYIASPAFTTAWSWARSSMVKVGGNWTVSNQTRACGTDPDYDDAPCTTFWGVGCSNGAGAVDKLYPGVLAGPAPKTCMPSPFAHSDGNFVICNGNTEAEYVVFVREE